MATTRTVAVFAGTLLIGCQSTHEEDPPAPVCELEFEPTTPLGVTYPEPTPCDPLEWPPAPIHLQPPVLVVERLDGSLLVADRFGGYLQYDYGESTFNSRVFAGDAKQVVRVRGSASGSSQSTEDYLYQSFGLEDGSLIGLIRQERKPGHPPHVIPEETELHYFPDGEWLEEAVHIEDAFPFGEPLKVLSECAVEATEAIDLPEIHRVEYVATDSEGNQIVVTAPDFHGQWSYEAHKLYFGSADAMLQREVTDFVRLSDGGTTHIYFESDSGPAVLNFVVGCNGAFTHDCPGTLEIDGETREVSIPSSDPELLAGMSFLCHDGW